MFVVDCALVISVDKLSELALYDALPQRWRRLVDSLPIPQRVASIEEYRRALGDEMGYARVVEVFSQKYPGWTLNTVGDLLTTVEARVHLARPPQRVRRRMIVVPTAE